MTVLAVDGRDILTSCNYNACVRLTLRARYAPVYPSAYRTGEQTDIVCRIVRNINRYFYYGNPKGGGVKSKTFPTCAYPESEKIDAIWHGGRRALADAPLSSLDKLLMVEYTLNLNESE